MFASLHPAYPPLLPPRRIYLLTLVKSLFERGAESVGLDFLAHPFWDKYLEFEERLEAHDRIFAILARVIHIPMHQYARYFERYRQMAANRPLTELAAPPLIEQFRQEVVAEAGPKQKSERDVEQDLRTRIDSLHLENFHRTQAETTKRWTYEAEVKRPYYHVTELDEPQLSNWRKYLDFEEAEGDYIRAKFLYERCLVTAANYEEFWLRYARWMLGQPGEKEEEVRNIYQRASCTYVPISRATIRLFYAQFEESQDRADVAVAIHEAILMNLPNHIEAIVSLANLHRRQYGLDSAINVLKTYIGNLECTVQTRGALVSEWARMMWKIKGSADEARQIYQANEQVYLECRAFCVSWLEFEMQQPTSEGPVETTNHKRVKAVFDSIRKRSGLDPGMIKEISIIYFAFLSERGGKNAMKEFMQLDRQINGPLSVASAAADDLTEGEEGSKTVVQNGHGSADAESAKYYAQPMDGIQAAR